MITKTMVDIAEEFLSKNNSSNFDELWTHVKTQKNPEFEKLAIQKKTTLNKIEQAQISEFYAILTIDGRFLRLSNADWALSENFSVEEKQKLHVSYAQTEE